MATSMLRLGRLGTLKCLRQDGWGSLKTPLSAAFCTKTEAPKKPAKKASSKTLEAPDERAALLAYKTTVAFPTRLSTPGFLSQGVALGEYDRQSRDPVTVENSVSASASTPQVSCEALSKDDVTAVDAKQAESVTDDSVQAETAAIATPTAETSTNKDAASPTSSDVKAPKDGDATSSSSSSSDSDSDSDSDDEKTETKTIKPVEQTEDKTGQEEMPSAEREGPTSDVKTRAVPESGQPSVFEGLPKGSPVGATEGSPVGATEGSPVGATEGLPEGATEGSPVGTTEGSRVGATEGLRVGATEGSPVGATEGLRVGATEGSPVGATEGSPVGATEGSPEGKPEVREAVSQPTTEKVPGSNVAAASSEEIIDPAPVSCTPESIQSQAEVIPEKNADIQVRSSDVSNAIPEPVTDSDHKPQVNLDSASETASEPKVESKAAPETTEAVAAAEELVDAAPVITDAEVQAEPEPAAAPEEAAPALEPEPFDNSMYKNLQHHNYNSYTFVDMDVEMAKHRLAQPSTGRPSPQH